MTFSFSVSNFSFEANLIWSRLWSLSYLQAEPALPCPDSWFSFCRTHNTSPAVQQLDCVGPAYSVRRWFCPDSRYSLCGTPRTAGTPGFRPATARSTQTHPARGITCRLALLAGPTASYDTLDESQMIRTCQWNYNTIIWALSYSTGLWIRFIILK